MEARAALVEQLLDLAWSHWTALGVAGSVAPAQEPIDLEALLILTAELAADDPRLRDEVLDWCSQFHGFASKPRLKQLLRRSAPSAQSSFGVFANALEGYAGRPWPGATEVSNQLTPLSGKSRIPPLTRPALLSLRLRALFGVSARADVIAALLLRPTGDFGAADLVFVGYTKRNIAQALDVLTAAGLFRSARTGNRVRFSWQRHRELSALFEPLPSRMPPWSISLRVLSGFLELSTRVKGKSDRLYAVEAARCFQLLAADLQTLEIEAPTISIGMTSEIISDAVLAMTLQLVRGSTLSRQGRRASR